MDSSFDDCDDLFVIRIIECFVRRNIEKRIIETTAVCISFQDHIVYYEFSCLVRQKKENSKDAKILWTLMV